VLLARIVPLLTNKLLRRAPPSPVCSIWQIRGTTTALPTPPSSSPALASEQRSAEHGASCPMGPKHAPAWVQAEPCLSNLMKRHVAMRLV